MSEKLKIIIGGKAYEWDATVSNVTPVEPPVVVNPPDPGPTNPPVTDGSFMAGTNDFHWVPLDKVAMFKTVRLYVAAGWIWRPGGLFVQPLFQAETANVHGLDDYFAAAKAQGLDVVPCINQVPDWYNGQPGDGSGSNNYPPVKLGKDRTAASSYQDYADFWFQFVARYGSTKHPDSALRVDTTPSYPNQPTNIKKSGLGLIKTVEIGNEWDRWWDVGTQKYVTPEEHAAMLWACYAACKKADPNIQVVMGGLTGFDLKYLQAMKAYFDLNKIKFQSDKINAHHYGNVRNEYGVWPPTWVNDGGCGPDQDKDFTMIDKIIAFANSINLKVWVTEFGVDSKGPSWMHCVGKNGRTDEQEQGKILVDTFKAYQKAGVERAYMFTAVDEPGAPNGGLWQTCGLMTNQADGFKPKPSYAAVQNYLKTLSTLHT